MEKIKDENGVEHEFLTSEEIDALVEEKKSEAVAQALQAKDADITKLNDELKIAKEALSGADQGTKDWAAARQQIKDLETKITEGSQERDKLKTEFAGEIRGLRTSFTQDKLNESISALAGNDKGLADKIQFHYERLGGSKGNTKEDTEKLKDAYLLATGKQAPNLFSVARGSFVGEAPEPREGTSREVSELGRKFGVSEEDVKKYSAKAKEKKLNQ